MNVERHQLAKLLFLDACELPANQVDRFLRERCGDDLELAQRVTALLAADAQQDDFLAPPPTALALGSADSVAGERGYRLLQRLGAGGMGEVWLAERADGSFQQRVAIKMMHAGQHYSRDALRRFRAERQILASLKHPNIARLLDGGTLGNGAPYLVMEYVDGDNIGNWCEQRALDLRARIALFLKVCDAVQSAHQALIVHRDLKPGNILIGSDGEPKLLDFGIAKVLDNEHFAQSLAHTQTGRAPMTLAYASPEQVRGELVGTVSDVYSLGVVLYELLTGRLPYRVLASDPVSMARAICEQAPDPPSRPTAAPATVAQPSRVAQQQSWRSQLRGDLDAIVLKALRKEAAERYRSVELLAADLQRYLDQLPVLARQGSRWYATRKFVVRHRLGVGVAVLSLVLTIAFGIDRQQQLLATAAQRDRAEQSLALLREVLSSADPAIARGEELTARQILAAGASKLQRNVAIAPDLRFDLLLTIGDIEDVLGLHDQALSHFDAASTLLDQLPPAASTRLDLERLQLLNNRGDSAAAEQLSARLLADSEGARIVLRPGELADLLVARGNALNLLGRGAEAEPLLRRALGLLPDGDEHARLRAAASGQLGQILQNLGQLAEAEQYLRAALAISQAQHFDPYRISRDQNNLAGVLAMQGRFAQALDLHHPAIEAFVAAVGKDHPEYGVRLNNLGMTEYGAGQVEQAISHLREAVELNRQRYGEQSPLYAAVLSNLAAAEAAAGEFGDAAAHVASALGVLQAKYGRGTLLVIRAQRNVGVIALEQRAFAQARSAFDTCIAGALDSHLEHNPSVSRCRLGLAELALIDGDFAAARRMLDEVRALQADLDPGHFERGMTALVGAQLALASGDPAGALGMLDAIAAPALNESWERSWRELLAAAARGDCRNAQALRAQLAMRHPQGHPRWSGLCADR